MNNNFTFDPEELSELCKKLRLRGFGEAVSELRSDPAACGLSQIEWVMTALRTEEALRSENALQRRLKNAQLKHKDATVANIDFAPGRGLKKSQLMNLVNGDWVEYGQNCLITGKTGVGKTWIASALGNACCGLGYKVKFIRFPYLIDDFRAAASTGGIEKLVRSLDKFDLLILDDWGYGKMETSSRRGMMELVESREKRKSILITSIIPVKEWARYIDDPTFADAINDRFLSKVIRLDLTGPSMRTGVA